MIKAWPCQGRQSTKAAHGMQYTQPSQCRIPAAPALVWPAHWSEHSTLLNSMHAESARQALTQISRDAAQQQQRLGVKCTLAWPMCRYPLGSGGNRVMNRPFVAWPHELQSGAECS